MVLIAIKKHLKIEEKKGKEFKCYYCGEIKKLFAQTIRIDTDLKTYARFINEGDIYVCANCFNSHARNNYVISYNFVKKLNKQFYSKHLIKSIIH